LIARDPGEIEEKLIKSFNASFPSAQQVHWYELPKAWVVNFVSEGVRSRIMYLKDGRMTEFTRYYQEAGLPFLIQSKVKKVYPNKKIFGVIEVSRIGENSSESAVEYFIKLEDDKNWLTIKADSETNLVVVEKYRKA
jgi:hypothetical protein